MLKWTEIIPTPWKTAFHTLGMHMAFPSCDCACAYSDVPGGRMFFGRRYIQIQMVWIVAPQGMAPAVEIQKS